MAGDPETSPRVRPLECLRRFFPDWRWLIAIVPPSLSSASEPGLVPLTLVLFVAWIWLLRRSWKRRESRKIALAQQPDFNLIDAFRIFDVESRGSVTSH